MKWLVIISHKMHFAILPALAGVLIVSCQRTNDAIKANEFSVEAAKEWYYSTFKKTPEWASSILKAKKLPDWKRGLYKKIGKMEIVEFPLVTAKKTVMIPSNENLTIADKKRITEASLSKISFIRRIKGQ